jgi:hypothetical protein
MQLQLAQGCKKIVKLAQASACAMTAKFCSFKNEQEIQIQG